MKKIIFLTLCCLSAQFASTQDTHFTKVYFKTGSHDLSEQARQELSEPLGLIGLYKINITGHTDNEGKLEDNRALSKRRAEAVRDYLINEGADAQMMDISYYGEEVPLTGNETEEDKKQNRRVEVVFLYGRMKEETPELIESINEPEPFEEPVVGNVIEIPDSIAINNLELYEITGRLVPEHEFVINNKRDTVLKLPSGTLVYFGKYIFDLPTESCRENVVIKISEYNRSSNAILGNMTTLSNDRLLYTAGMFRVRAFCNQQEVELEEDKEYTIFFPVPDNVRKNTRSFMGFYGEEDELSQEVNWEKASSRRLLNVEGDNICNGSRNRSGGRGGGSYDEKKKTCFISKMFVKRNFRPKMPKELRRKVFATKRSRQKRKEAIRQFQRSAQIQSRIPGVDFDVMTSVPECGRNYLVFNSQRMGFINCDAFWDVKEEDKTHILVKVPPKHNTQVRIAFKSRNSIMNANGTFSNGFRFDRIPDNEEIWIVAIKKREDGKFMLGLKAANTSEENIDIEMKEYESEEEVKEMLAQKIDFS